MFKFVIPAIAALGLTAAAAQSYSPEAETPSAPVMGWHLSHEGAMAKLAYGVENSDQLALMVICEPGHATATVYGDVQPKAARMVQAAVATDPLSGGDAVEARIALRDPAMQTLARNGKIEVEGEAGAFMLEANAGERRLISEFFAHCAKSDI